MGGMMIEVPETDSEYLLYNTLTKKWETDTAVLVREGSGEKWERTTLSALTSFLGLAGGKQTKVLVHLLRNKNHDNLVIGSQRKISKDTGVSLPVVTMVLKLLQKEGYVTMVANCIYMLRPDIARYASKTAGHVLYAKWKKSGGGDYL